MTIDYIALKTEILTDPTARGYSGKEDNAVAVLLNEIQAGITIKRDNISPNEVLEAIDNRDFIASPNIAHCSWFESVTQLRSLRLVNDDNSNTKVLGNLNRLITDTQGSQTRVLALANRNGSRAEQLYGRNTVVSDVDVAVARRS